MSINSILDALDKLDPANDNHWTADGLPKVETVRLFAGSQSIGREEITAANPSFNRAIAAQNKQVGEQAGEPVAPADTVVTDTSLPQEETSELVQQIVQDETFVAELEGLSEVQRMQSVLQKMYAQRERLNAEIRQVEDKLHYAILEEQENASPEEDPVTAYLRNRQRIQNERAAEIAGRTAL